MSATIRIKYVKAKRGMPFHDPQMYRWCVRRDDCDSDRVRIDDGIGTCATCGANWITGHRPSVRIVD